MLELFQVIGVGLAILLPLANPITAVALLLGLSQGMTTKQINHEALMAAIYVFIIMIVAFYGGQLVMNTLGISIPGLRIAGGLIVTFIGFQMLFPTKEIGFDITKSTVAELQTQNKDSIAFIPLAMPGTAGPGTIAMIISSASTIQTQATFSPIILKIAPIFIFLTISILLWLCLRSANTIMKWIGKGGVEAISRLMGFLLVCMGVQFVINGVLELIATHS
ncbi:MarC family NAAT transporter [Entomomonas sp. E2T0]|uniref:MarC family NAAT transporter n=1 Tax=Entomomonas sp. E2T0 TaxID=2930213 RepID=UPI0022284D8F|nr:MarC family NAAT transporter [Entomomonas sp. E2T0]